MGVNKFSTFSKVLATLVASLLMTAGFIPSNAKASPSNVTVYSAVYQQPYEWGVPVTIQTASANQLHFNGRFESSDYSSKVGKTLSYTNPITTTAPLLPGDFTNRAVFRFGAGFGLISEVTIQPEGGAAANVPTSVVVPASTEWVQVTLTSDYVRSKPNGHTIPQAAITVNYTVKLDGVTQTVTTAADNQSAPATAFYRFSGNDILTVDDITGPYDTTNVGDSDADIFTCVTVDPSVNLDSLTATLFSNGAEISTVRGAPSPFMWMANVGGGSLTSGATITKASVPDVYAGGQIVVSSRVLEQQGSAQSIPRGPRGPYQLEILNGAGVDVSDTCKPNALTSTPVAQQVWSSIQFAMPGDLVSQNETWKLAIYRESDQSAPVFNSPVKDGWNQDPVTISLTNPDLPHGEPLVAKFIRVVNPNIYDHLDQFKFESDPSPASNPFTLPKLGATIPNSLSNGTGPGQAVNQTPAGSEYDFSDAHIPGLWANMVPDGKDGFLRGFAINGQDQKVEIFHLTKNGLDPNFAGTGNKSWKVNLTQDPQGTMMSWFGARDKWAVSYSLNGNQDNDTSWANANQSLVVVSGTTGTSNIVSTTLSGSSMNAFCSANFAGSKYVNVSEVAVLPTPMSTPVLSLGCTTYNADDSSTLTKYFIVKLITGNAPSLSKLYQLTKGNDPVASMTFWGAGGDVSNGSSFTAFPFATAATDTAFAFYALSGSVDSSTWKFVPREFNLVRIKMNGTVTETANPYGLAAGDYDLSNSYFMDLVPALPSMTVGETIHAIDRTKHYVSTSGAFDSGTTFTIEANNAFSSQWAGVSWSLGTLVGGAPTANLLRYQYNGNTTPNTQAMAPVSLNLTTNVATTGEVVSLEMPTASSAFLSVAFDDAGALNVYVETDPGKYSWIKWNALVADWTSGGGNGGGGDNGGGDNGGGSNSNGTVTKVSSKYVLAGLGGTLTLNGTGLNLATTVTIGGVSAKVTKKTATTLTVTVPKNLAAGAQPLVINFASGDPITGQSITYIAGKVPQAQVIAPPISVPANNTPWTGTGLPLVIPASTNVGLGVVVTLSPAATCAMVSGIPTIVGAGTCTVTVTQGGDLGTKKVTQTTKVVIAKGVLSSSVGGTFTVTDNPLDDGSSNNEDYDRRIVPTSNFPGAVNTFSSSNPEVCTVDDDGVVAGVNPGTCVVTVVTSGGNNWVPETKTVSVTVSASSNVTIPDELPEASDGNAPAVVVPSSGTNFAQTNDPSLSVKWDKAKGLLTLKSKGIYTGYILAKTTFTGSNGVTYTCTNIFGTVKAMPGKTSAQRKAAMKQKSFLSATAVCKDASGLSVPGSNGVAGNLATSFSKIKKTTKAKGTATTVGTKTYEAAGQAQLKGFTGTVTFKITRYRAMPTTMKNAYASGKRIPTATRTTVVTLQ